MRALAVAPLTLLLLGAPATGAPTPSPIKERAVELVGEQRAALTDLSRRIWSWAETALAETRSAEALAAYAESHGLEVERGVAGLPTAFVASYGSGQPIIAILGEYDALPGLSQDAVPRRQVLVEGGAGHGCGHNLFGPASLGAAVALKELLAAGELAGTIRFYGTPAEESVGGKLYMIRAGLFDDVDAVLAWHPDTVTAAETDGSQAMAELSVEFRGEASHAAYDPWNGHSALDAAELFTHALNLLREHVRPTVRMHYVISDGGDVPNVVPEYARVWCWLRDSTHQGVDHLIERARQMAQGAALAAAVEGEVEVTSGDWEMLPNMAASAALHRNLVWLGPPSWSEAERDFAHRLQEAAGVEPTGLSDVIEPFEEDPGEPEGGSTDVADVSWIAPTVHLTAATAPRGIPWHAWPVVAASGSAIGQRGMIYAGSALAATAVDLFADGELLAAARQEFETATAGIRFELYLRPGPPPLPAGAAAAPSGDVVACDEPRPRVCTQEVDPVCALHWSGARRTFANACTACSDPANVSHSPGACHDD